jgi:hypothetical protein
MELLLRLVCFVLFKDTWRGVLDTTLCEKCVSDLRQVGGFLRVLRYPPPI